MTDREYEEGGYDSNETKGKTSFISVLCKLQRCIMVFGCVMFVIWFIITYGSQTSDEENDRSPVAMKMTASKKCCKMQIEKILLSGRLPDHVIPYHYNLTLQFLMPPEFEFGTVGNVVIFIECLKPTDTIVVHARDLFVYSANITGLDDSGNRTKQTTNVAHFPEQQMIFIQFNEPLKADERYELDIDFFGQINNQTVGLYRSSYKTEDGNVSWVVSTQFQPNDARRAFPCFDEPALKSTFQLNIVKKKNTTSLSNMPEVNSRLLNNYWEIASFEITPVMSTYLLAFVVGDIKPYSDIRHRSVQIWSQSNMAEHGEYAYNITADILEYFNEYFGIPYALPKTDLVAIPSFLHAAMENWGLITFDEYALLYDPERSSSEIKVFITLVIAHEVAHQWFGNLVTLTWWDRLWLNEGFATYYEYLCVDALRPEWHIKHHFISSIYEVMESDSLQTTRSMGAAVPPLEVVEYFDEISYLKGSAIVQMMQHFLGERNFRRGLRNYLLRYSYNNVKELYLWQNLNLWNRNADDVKRIMKGWTDQPGYPVIKFVREYANKSVKVTQSAFVIKANDEPLELEEGLSVTNDYGKDKRLWIIPITLTNGEELDWSTKTDFWLKLRTDVIQNISDEKTWIIANIQQVGYYRVNYDNRNWDMLLSQLLHDHSVIHVINRAQILNDALNLARSDHVEYSLALNLTKYLYREEENLPWQSAFTTFRYMDLMLSRTSAYQQWKEYVLTLMSPLYEKLGWTNSTVEDTIPTKVLRKNILKWSCKYGRDDCVNTAVDLFHEWRNDTTKYEIIPTDDREIVLCTGIENGSTDDWEFMWKKYLAETFKGERLILLRSLACTREIKLLKKLLKRALNSSYEIPLEEASNVFAYAVENFNAREVVYKFFISNADIISFKFGFIPFSGSNIIDKVTAQLNTENEINELESILKKRKVVSASMYRHLKMALQTTKNNLYWMNNKYDQVYSWLLENLIE